MTVWVSQQLFSLQRRSIMLLGFVLLLVVVATHFFINSTVYAQTAPSTTKVINFSARLKSSDGTVAPDGLYNVSFRLYTAQESGTPVWAESHIDENGTASGSDHRVKVTNGYLNVKLGSRTAFGSSVNWNDNLWLTMNIGGTVQTSSVTSIPWDGEMSPRIQLSAVPYAMNAGLLDGKKAGDFIQLGQGQQTNSSDNPSIQINTTGRGNLVQLQRDGKDVFTVDNDGNIAFGNGSNHTISIDQGQPNTDGRTLAISGGDGGDGTSNGGNLVLSGGSGSGEGVAGLVVLTTATFATATNDGGCYARGAPVSSSCTVMQSTVDSSSAVIVGFSAEGQTATLPDPTLATPGRILYVMAANDSLPFSLLINGGESISMRSKAALTLLWNGSDWTLAGHTGSAVNTPPDTNIVEEPAPEQPIAIESDTEAEALDIEPAAPTESDSANDPATDPDTDTDPDLPFQLDSFNAAPKAAPGSMYYDTTLGKVQCYEETGWGACGDAPDTFVTISPEYTNAVMNGTDIGIISSDFCSGTLGINDGSDAQPAVCNSDETYNFYRWTSNEESTQTRSIYLTYQLPDNFKGFIPGSTSIMGRTDNDNATVSYQVYRDNGSGLLSCGTPVTVSSGEQPAWQKGLASDESDPVSCDFEAGDSILFRINLTAMNTANAYVSNVNFIFRNS